MPFDKISTFEKSFPQIASLTPEQKQKALEIFNALLRDNPNINEGRAIAISITSAKKVKTSLSEKMFQPPVSAKNNLNDYVEGTIYMLNEIKVDNGSSIIEILRIGKIQDRGLDITEEMLNDYVNNFNQDVYGSPIQVNLRHDREGEAAGWIKSLIKDGDILLAEVEWTPLGKEKILNKQFQFTSAELAPSIKHYGTGEKVNNVLIGVALTNIPAVKGLPAVQLSEQVQLYINSNTMKKFLKIYEKLSEKEAITLQELEEAKEEAEKIEGEEEKNEANEKVNELEKKVKKEKEKEESKDEDKKEENKEEPKKEENLSDKSQFVSLSEYEAEKQKRMELTEKIEKMELKETVKEKLLLSESNPIGFKDEKELDEALDFIVGLAPSQRETYFKLHENMKTVILKTIGSVNCPKVEKLSESKLEEEAKKYMKENNCTYAEALKDIAPEGFSVI